MPGRRKPRYTKQNSKRTRRENVKKAREAKKRKLLALQQNEGQKKVVTKQSRQTKQLLVQIGVLVSIGNASLNNSAQIAAYLTDLACGEGILTTATLSRRTARRVLISCSLCTQLFFYECIRPYCEFLSLGTANGLLFFMFLTLI